MPPMYNAQCKPQTPLATTWKKKKTTTLFLLRAKKPTKLLALCVLPESYTNGFVIYLGRPNGLVQETYLIPN